jgi:hypothetical protein
MGISQYKVGSESFEILKITRLVVSQTRRYAFMVFWPRSVSFARIQAVVFCPHSIDGIFDMSFEGSRSSELVPFQVRMPSDHDKLIGMPLSATILCSGAHAVNLSYSNSLFFVLLSKICSASRHFSIMDVPRSFGFWELRGRTRL